MKEKLKTILVAQFICSQCTISKGLAEDSKSAS